MNEFLLRNKVSVAVVVILSLGIGGFILLRNQATTSPVLPQPQIQTQQPPASTDQFSTPKKAAHFESNTPEHGAALAGVPLNVVINFNFDLAKGSEIRIEMGGQNYGVRETIIDQNTLTMRRKMDSTSPNGIYTVSYRACWADGSCHDGQFQFKIDRSLSKDFIDMTNKKEVAINLQNYAFSPAKIKISKGTKITWNNQDSVAHTVNTDSHPAHTYFLAQNSRDLQKGDSYSATFEDEGVYLYHCTPHADSMHGQILVE